jgi:cobalamin synthase
VVGAANLAGPVAAAIVVAADLAITRMLHVDGLADSDGLLPHLDRERRLAVMCADVGAFGVAVVTIVLLLQVTALAATEPQAGGRSPYWRLSGAARPMAVTMTVVPTPATPDWPVPPAHQCPITAAGRSSPSPSCGRRRRGGPGQAGPPPRRRLARRRIGGFTGDVLERPGSW